MLGTRFNLIALSLEENNLMTSRMLTMSIIEHTPNMVRERTSKKMI